MFIKRNRTRHGEKEYHSVLLVQGKRVPATRKTGRPRKGEVQGTMVVHETLANLSKLSEPLIAMIDRFCKAERDGRPVDGPVGDGSVAIGPVYGPLAILRKLAQEAGIERALGASRQGQLALFLVLARLIHQGSRLSAVRWAEDQAVAEALGIEAFDENDLYRALDWLEKRQVEVEQALTPSGQVGTVFLYDVSSSYFEGQKNELAAAGYNRDGKKFKKQIVYGLLTDAQGEPVSVQVYNGNTADPTTVADQAAKLRDRFHAQEIVLVGDRGMLRGPACELLGDHVFRYITSLTDAEVRGLLAAGTLQIGLFDEQVAEVVAEDGRRYVLRRNPKMTDRIRSKRTDQLAKVQAKVDRRNAYMDEKPAARIATSEKYAAGWLKSYKLEKRVSVRADGRHVRLETDPAAWDAGDELDGCYVVLSDVPAASASAQTLWDRYGDLQKVERDFRTLKTGLLQIRPIFLRKAVRTRAHALVAMLALKLARAVERRVAPLGLTVVDVLDRLAAVRLVSLADPALGLWRLPDRYHEPVQRVLNVMPALPAPMLSRHRTGPS